jgi:hypothetical protein
VAAPARLVVQLGERRRNGLRLRLTPIAAPVTSAAAPRLSRRFALCELRARRIRQANAASLSSMIGMSTNVAELGSK